MKILFATDGSPEAEKAREMLGVLPLPPGSEIIVVSVVSQAGESRPGEVESVAPAQENTVAKETADEAAYRLAKPGVSTECLVARGHPADKICRVAEEEEVDLVVMGSRGRSSLARFFMGGTSQHVAKHASSPVLVVKPPVKPIEKVLIGVDGSEDSRRAVKFLKHFPLPSEAAVYIVHVVHVPSPAYEEHKGYYETAGLGTELERLRSAAEVDGKKILEESARCLERVFTVETLVTAGPPARRLIELAAEMNADLLVVGSRGLTGVERFLMGSVSLQVCLHAPCAVLIVHG